MNDGRPSGLELLWMAQDPAARKPRLGLSLERIIESGVDLADSDGLGAVSMKRVAERLGFTTMSLYRYVTSKEELLLLMQDAVWQPPPDLDMPLDGWRGGLEVWCREQYAIIQRHRWLEQVRDIERVGTPSAIAWMELGLRALTGTTLTEYQKLGILLVLSGYVSSHARNETTVADGARLGLYAPDQATQAFGELLRTIISPERFPALVRAAEGGAFAGSGSSFVDFAFGLDIFFDGIERLMKRQAAGEAPKQPD